MQKKAPTPGCNCGGDNSEAWSLAQQQTSGQRLALGLIHEQRSTREGLHCQAMRTRGKLQCLDAILPPLQLDSLKLLCGKRDKLQTPNDMPQTPMV